MGDQPLLDTHVKSLQRALDGYDERSCHEQQRGEAADVLEAIKGGQSPPCDAGAHPGAVMVALEDTMLAHCAVEDKATSVDVTGVTVPPCVGCLCIVISVCYF